MNHIRVEIEKEMHKSRVFFVADDGTETDVSSVVTGIQLGGKVGDATTATLSVIKVDSWASAELTNLLVKELRPPRRGRLKRLFDVTTFGNYERRYAT